jgi:hypothetical protein
MVATHASIGAVPKAKGAGFRPIMIGQIVSRCIASCQVRRSRDALRSALEAHGQYAMSGVVKALEEPLVAVAECAMAGVPWAWVRQDWRNAFNATTQHAMADGVRRMAEVAPELAATSLRVFALARGPVERVIHGRYAPEQDVLSVLKHPAGGDQGDPRTPPVFCMAAAPIEDAARRDGEWLVAGADAGEVERRLWRAMRDVAPRLPVGPPAEWTAALGDALRTRPAAARVAVPATSIYMDDGLTAGWLVATLYRAFRRSTHARPIGLVDDPLENLVLVPEALVPVADAILQPLRDALAGDRTADDGPTPWRVVTTMRVLGVDITDPTNRAGVDAAVRECLRHRVVRPIRRLVEDMERGGGARSAAFWVARTFVFANLAYVQQLWGLHASPEAWDEADAALDELCEALCPPDLRRGLRDESSTMREELALPMKLGGLGVTFAGRAAPVMAAGLWSLDAARRTGAHPAALAAAYRSPAGSGVPGARPEKVSLEAFAEACAEALAERVPMTERRLLARRRELNSMRGGVWVFDGVPWDSDRCLTDSEWDVAWRLAFGGITEAQRVRIDRPEEGFAWRGRAAEWAVKRAVEEEVPAPVRVWEQPGPDRLPTDHVARCVAARESPDAWRRADLAFEVLSGRTVTVDVRTVNCLSRSGVSGHASAAVHFASIEALKRRRYAGYYDEFRPLAISLTGAVTEDSFSTIKRIAKAAADASGPRLDWEPHRWAVLILRRVQVAVVRTVTAALTRAPFGLGRAERLCVPRPPGQTSDGCSGAIGRAARTLSAFAPA